MNSSKSLHSLLRNARTPSSFQKRKRFRNPPSGRLRIAFHIISWIASQSGDVRGFGGSATRGIFELRGRVSYRESLRRFSTIRKESGVSDIQLEGLPELPLRRCDRRPTTMAGTTWHCQHQRPVASSINTGGCDSNRAANARFLFERTRYDRQSRRVAFHSKADEST